MRDQPTLFDAYVPTATQTGFEVRVRSSASGPVTLSLNGGEVVLGPSGPAIGGVHCYRHFFDGLGSGAVGEVSVRQPPSPTRLTVRAATLPPAPGAPRLRIGILADLHLPPAPAPFQLYRGGTRRLTGLAQELGGSYIRRLEALGADCIVLPGDLVDPCTEETLARLQQILDAVSIPCYPIIGNHEPWSAGGAALFYDALGLPPCGYYSVRENGVLMVMLSTPDQDALDPGTDQYRWLVEQLDASRPSEDVVIFSHFSCLLHPCVQGFRDDGYQLLHNHRELLRLFEVHPNVRLFVAGHKNVPSLVVRGGVLHTLSPQLIQWPCGYDMLHLFEGGASRVTYEIDEQHYCELARAAYGPDWQARFGTARDRCFSMAYPAR